MTLLRTAGLLVISNIFMTVAWYGHLKFRDTPLWIAILGAWGLALIEYIFQVPANRLSYGQFSGYQLKILQECITLVIFVLFAALYLGEGLNLRHALSFGLIFAAAAVSFW